MSAESFDFVISSQIRLTVLSFLSHNSCTPTQLAKTFEKHLSHISRALRELENKDLVICSSPPNSKPRVYQLTNDGSQLLKEIYRYQTRVNPI
ncbi:MAG: ArsR family transcriptional regulator [Nitrososphaerota archaeon]|nr:ArsR family transcriptional regulator [Nitrososphaerota archaeon]